MGLGLTPEIYATGTHTGDHELSYVKKRSIPRSVSGNDDTERLRLTPGNGGYFSSISHPKSKTPSLEEESQRMGVIRRDFHVRISYEDARDPAYQADISH